MKEKAQSIRARFGDNVRRLRKYRGFSQESFADACGLDRTYIGGVERGERNIGIDNINKIALALKIESRQLFEFASDE